MQFTRGRDPAALGVLASVHAASERWPEAIATAEQALALAERTGPATLAERLREELEAYRARGVGVVTVRLDADRRGRARHKWVERKTLAAAMATAALNRAALATERPLSTRGATSNQP